MSRPAPCRACSIGQRLSTLSFAVFAVLLSLAANDPAETPTRAVVLALCAALSGIAVFRFGIAALVARVLQVRRD